MIVINLTKCPPALRGDLTKWFMEIGIGVYVGQVSAKVRDEVWGRIKENIKSGQAIMAFSAKNEQHMSFRVHNTSWKPVDFDGLKLMLRPNRPDADLPGTLKDGFSRASKKRKAKQFHGKNRGDSALSERYIIIDLETTGLSPSEHKIIEIGAIIIQNGKVEREFQALIKISQEIPEPIQKLTGITNAMLEEDGENLKEVLIKFLKFSDNLTVVSHNSKFDYDFLRTACSSCGLPVFSNKCVDTLTLAKKSVYDVKDYKLSTLIDYFGIKSHGMHRSRDDCLNVKQLYDKLIELQN